jgi:hypothetical protein
VRISVTHLAFDSGVSPVALKAASADAVKQAALAAEPTLLEPIMKVPPHALYSLSSRRHHHHGERSHSNERHRV